LAVGLWFGTAVFFSFVVALSLFRTFEAETQKLITERPRWLAVPAEFDRTPATQKEMGSRLAGVAVSPLFTWYFLIQGACGFLATLTALGWPRLEPGVRVHKVRALVLILALATVVLGWPLERKVSELRVERNEASDAYLFNKASRDSKPHVQAPAVGANFKAEADALRAEFARWHLYSLVLNLVTVLLVTVAMALAAQLPN